MTSFSSRSFISSSAHGDDWRSVAKTCLEELDAMRTPEDGINIGFLYLSDMLANEAETILYLFQEATGIDAWVGTVGVGICASDGQYFNEAAISAMMGRLPEDSFSLFPAVTTGTFGLAREMLSPWMAIHQPMLALVHADPFAGDPQPLLQGFVEDTGCFPVGGLTSSRGKHPQFCGTCSDGGMSGVIFSSDINALTGVSQGCSPIGAVHTVSAAKDNMVQQLDGKPALEVMSSDLQDSLSNMPGLEALAHSPEAEMTGEVLVAIPIRGSDTGDFLVRNMAGIDPETGSIAIAELISEGDSLLFVQRLNSSAVENMEHMLEKLKSRCNGEKPKGGVYISCAGRGPEAFPEERTEVDMIRETFGEFPLTGFYASGEFSAGRLYTYSGVLTLFL